MPYATCPNCNDSCHFNIAKDIEKWNEKYPTASDGIRYIECFYCWKELKEFDCVEVINLPIENITDIEQGDIGAVVMVHSIVTFEVECGNTDGTTKWLHALPRKNLKYKREKSADLEEIEDSEIRDYMVSGANLVREVLER